MEKRRPVTAGPFKAGIVVELSATPLTWTTPRASCGEHELPAFRTLSIHMARTLVEGTIRPEHEVGSGNMLLVHMSTLLPLRTAGSAWTKMLYPLVSLEF
jgi:hypothetical protein